MNLNFTSPAYQYQLQKAIQNTIGVYESLYLADLASLNVYSKPISSPIFVEQAGTPYIVPPGVNWNQMSDRPIPSVQEVKTSSGSTYRGSSTKHSIMRNRPGSLSPGGVGVDIKHNSYNRYLNRLKGQGPVRRGVIPPTYGLPIPYNPAFPIYGGKTIKTNIVGGCDCPLGNNNGDQYIYGDTSNATQDQISKVSYQFSVGEYVWAFKMPTDTTLYKAQIISITGNVCVIQFLDDQLTIQTSLNNVLIYYDCNCQPQTSLEEQVLNLEVSGSNVYLNAQGTALCSLLSSNATSAVF
jgi:hypothetical protein